MFGFAKRAVEAQLADMAQRELYVVDVEKDTVYETYLSSFVEGTNPMFRERTEHDCSTCRQFIKNMGRVVGVQDNQLISIWDVTIDHPEAGAIYNPVFKALSKLIKSAKIARPFRTREPMFGGPANVDTENPELRWEHFCYKVGERFRSQTPERVVGPMVDDKTVLEASLITLAPDAITTALELIDGNVLYRGTEHRPTVVKLQQVMSEFVQVPESDRDAYLWGKSVELKRQARFKNTVIGTLIADLSTDMDVEAAVHRFDSKMEGYKRTTAVITKSMIAKAEQRVSELGFGPALQRRYAVRDDLTVNNVLYTDSSVKLAGSTSVFDTLREEVPDKVGGKPRDIALEEFLRDIPAGPIELMLENHNNLVSLIAPADPEAPNILKWDNNFSWTYHGDLTDSRMRQRVQAAGGKTDGVLRFSIQWNETGKNINDLDAHCIEPDGNRIYYSNMRGRNGVLDVDITVPERQPEGIAVENIIFPTSLRDGKYQFLVHNFASRGLTSGAGKGFNAEIEFAGQTHTFHYPGGFAHKQYIKVADVINDKGQLKLIKHLDGKSQAVEKWGVSTQKWVPVDIIMRSPNFWDGQRIGNSHVFFMLRNCVNPESSRGLYNEFLSDQLREERKVFDHLGAKLRTPLSNDQLSGVGYSSTIPNSVLCKTSRGIFKILFGTSVQSTVLA